MRIKDMTFEELEALETELNDAEEEGDYSLYNRKINVYEEMYRKLNKIVRENIEEESYLESIRKQLVAYLIRYGSYLKMQYEKDDNLAIDCLVKALKYDRTNPIASYRLGFLLYKQKNYKKALNYFHKTLEDYKFHKDQDYLLNEKQIVNAHLYLTNSALYIAKQTHDQLDNLKFNKEQSLPNYEFSELYESLIDNENYLKRNAFYKVTNDGTKTFSKEDCENLIINPPIKTIILYFSDRNIQLLFNGEEELLSPTQADILKFLLTNSSGNRPVKSTALQKFFPNYYALGGVPRNTLNQTLTRVRQKLRRCSIPEIIQTTTYQNETAYFFNQTLPYIVMYRVDEEIEY